MGHGALRMTLALLLVAAVTAGVSHPVRAQPDVFAAMNALRAMPPVPAPDVTFRGLDGRPVRLQSFRGRPVLLTFFTTW